jgi:hypothetical protein
MEAFHTLHAPASFYKIIFYIYYITKSPYFNLIIAKKKKNHDKNMKKPLDANQRNFAFKGNLVLLLRFEKGPRC